MAIAIPLLLVMLYVWYGLATNYVCTDSRPGKAEECADMRSFIP